MANTINIPLDAPVDLETRNIIQGDFSFTKKNSLVHQGLLSNMTRKRENYKTNPTVYSTTGQLLNYTQTGKTTILQTGSFQETIQNAIRVARELHFDVGEEILAADTDMTYGKTYVVTKSGTMLKVWVLNWNFESSEATVKPKLMYSVTQAQASSFAADVICAVGASAYTDIAYSYVINNVVRFGAIQILASDPYDYTSNVTVRATATIVPNITGNTSLYLAYNGKLFMGFDDVDMRNRITYVYSNTTFTGTPNTITGFGCVSRANRSGETVTITGEPILRISNTPRPSSLNLSNTQLNFWGYLYAEYEDRTPVDLYINPNYMAFQDRWDTRTLENGVIQTQPFDPNAEGIKYKRFTGDQYSTDNPRDSLNFTTADFTETWIKKLKKLGPTPESTEGSQTGQDNFPNQCLIDYYPGDTSATEQCGAIYIYALVHPGVGNNIFTRSFDAMTRFMPQAAQVKDFDGSPAGFENEARNWGTLISYMDYEDPIGIWGDAIDDDTKAYDGTQLFPHFRFFVNDTTKKGKNWDYGRGWCRFIKATLEVQKSGPWRIFERPLELWTFEGDKLTTVIGPDDTKSTKIEYLDIAPQSHIVVVRAGDSTSQKADKLGVPFLTAVRNDSSIRNTANKYIAETNWVSRINGNFREGTGYPYADVYNMDGTARSAWSQVYGKDSLATNSTEAYLSTFGRYYQMARLVRLHPMYEAQKNSDSWVFSHHLGGVEETAILPQIPFSVHLATFTDNEDTASEVRAQIYNGMEVSLSYKDCLLNTPHDMGDKYNFGLYNYTYAAFTFWSSSKVDVGMFSISGNTVTRLLPIKVADYLFKTNVISGQGKNLLVESPQGTFELQRAFIPYIMDCTIDTSYKNKIFALPNDSSTYTSNDIYYYGFGINTLQDSNQRASSFLLPAVSVSSYCDTGDLYDFNKIIINGRKGLFRASSEGAVTGDIIDEFYTHSQATTDILYKNSRLVQSDGTLKDVYNEDLANTSWWPTTETVIYPVGILSKISGENYVTSTVDVGDNYAARFYRNNGRTFLNFNMKDQVYFGSEIFTIQSGNYYFDGQGIYYLGSQSDYSQNIFTAYAVGMRFLANSSAEAYFYAPWDKSLYVYTASNTLQKAQSFADMSEPIDAVYSSAEQALYVLFPTGLYIKTQSDSCVIEGNYQLVDYLQTTAVGCQIVDPRAGSPAELYSPCLWDATIPLELETEWLGNGDTLTRYQYVDVILYSDDPINVNFNMSVQALNGGEIVEDTKQVLIQKTEWKNHMCRVRMVPNQIIGNAVKIKISSDLPKYNYIQIFSLSVTAEPVSQTPSAARNKRY